MALSLVVFILLLDTAIVAIFMEWIIELRYFGAFIIGLLFVSLFTTTPAVVLIVLLVGKGANPFLAAAVDGVGSMIADYVLMRFV